MTALLAAAAVVASVALLARGRAELAGRRCRHRLAAARGWCSVPDRDSETVRARRARRGVRPPAVVARSVHDLALGPAPETVWTAWVVAVGAAAVGGFVVGGVALAGASATTAVTAPVLVAVVGRGRRARLVDRQLPLVLDRLARAVRAGSSLATAFAGVGVDAPEPLAGELARLTTALQAGRRLTSALEDWSARCPTPGVRLVVAATTLGHDAGGAQARALDAVGSTLRERHAVQREARALATQARASAAVIVLAPLGFAVFSAATDPAVLGFLVGTPLGVACLAAALLLDACGAVWMARLTRGVA